MRVSRYALIALVLLSVGCRSHVKTRSFGVEMAPVANDRTPVEVEFVAVRDDALLATLLEMNASDWFAQRAQLKSDYPKELQTVSWEFVPGQRVAPRKLPLRRRGAKALIVFASYSTPGAHRLRADPYKRITLRLGESEFSIEETK